MRGRFCARDYPDQPVVTVALHHHCLLPPSQLAHEHEGTSFVDLSTLCSLTSSLRHEFVPLGALNDPNTGVNYAEVRG